LPRKHEPELGGGVGFGPPPPPPGGRIVAGFGSSGGERSCVGAGVPPGAGGADTVPPDECVGDVSGIILDETAAAGRTETQEQNKRHVRILSHPEPSQKT
jgi:hypothetical protein